MNKKWIYIGLILLIIALSIYALFFYKPTNFIVVNKSGQKISCERGYVAVPENRFKKESRTISVEYVRLKSFAQKPAAPIFYLSGGPGQGATSQIEYASALENWSKYLAERDVIFIDQRGIGKLNMWWFQFKWPTIDLFASEGDASKHVLNMAEQAIPEFKKRGIDLDGYNSVESAQDLDDVRRHLHYDKIIPFGFSYGTHLGLSYIKHHEVHVDKAVLIGVEGLNQNFKMPMDLDNHFIKLAAMIDQDTTNKVLIPDFMDLYRRVSENLAKSPVEIEIETPIKLKRKVRVGKFGLDFILKRDLGDANDIPVFPLLLYTIDQGEYGVLKAFVEKRYLEFLATPAMMLSMDLASGGTSDRLAQVKEEEQESMFGKVANFPFMDLHGLWPVRDLGDNYRKATQSNVPALFLSGDLDINTPAYQAELVSEGFPNGVHLIVENAGHEQIIWHKEMTNTILNFLGGEDVSQVSLANPPLKFYKIRK